MKQVQNPYKIFQSASAVLMMVALLWLTISAPFMLKCQQEIAKQHNITKADLPLSDNEDGSSTPLGNTTEEKAPNSINSFSEEYLHNHHDAEYLLSIALQYQKNDDAGLYIAFHGELLVPPPNAA